MLRRKLGSAVLTLFAASPIMWMLADYGVLSSSVPVEGLHIHCCDVTQRTIDCMQYVWEIFGNLARNVWNSYRDSFKQYLISVSLGNAIRGKDIGTHPEQVLRVDLKLQPGSLVLCAARDRQVSPNRFHRCRYHERRNRRRVVQVPHVGLQCLGSRIGTSAVHLRVS